MSTMRLVVALIAALVTTLAHADEESAREHFQRGQALYEATRYEAALHEFEKAQASQPMSALLYDIARCLEKLDRKEEAAKAYERYIDSAPNADNLDEVRALVVELHRGPLSPSMPSENVQIAHIDVTQPLAPTARRRYIVPGALGGGVLVLGAIGAGLLGSAAHDFGALRSSCSPTCSASSWSALPAREHAGEALLGVAGAVLVVDVALWVRAARRK
jgi:tetratricopeptide (TPR) repeat protein